MNTTDQLVYQYLDDLARMLSARDPELAAAYGL